MFLTSKELAARWKLTEQRLRQWRVHSIGPKYYKLGDGSKAPVRYLLDDVKEWETRNNIGGKK